MHKPDFYQGAAVGSRCPTAREAILSVIERCYGYTPGDLDITSELVIRPRTHRFWVTWDHHHSNVDIEGLWNNDEQEEWGVEYDDADDFPF